MISVIIPVYNRERYIESCINSVLMQSFQDFEIIVVDDGSDDSTGQICDRMASDDRRIIVVHQQNSGASAARQCGLDNSKGEWICFLDSDDTLPRNALKNYSSLSDDNFQIIVSGVKGRLTVDSYLLGLMNYSVCPALWGKLFRSDLCKANMPELPVNLVMGEDMIANLKLGLAASSIGTIEELQYSVSDNNPDSITKTFIKTFQSENLFFDTMDSMILSKCSGRPIYEQMIENEFFLKMNGYKNVVIDGNRINVASDEWRTFMILADKYRNKLSKSEKLFVKTIGCQSLFGLVMRLYLILKSSKH